MRIYNPIYPSIKDNLEELFGKAPTSITLTSYSAQYSIADQGTCKIKGHVYPQDAVNQQVLITYTSQKEGSILTYSINYGEDSTGKYFEISVSTTTEDVYSIRVKAKGSSSVQADIFTLIAVSEVPITNVYINWINPPGGSTGTGIDAGEEIIGEIIVEPSNYTQDISNVRVDAADVSDSEKSFTVVQNSHEKWSLSYRTTKDDVGLININIYMTIDGDEQLVTGDAIIVNKVINPMADNEITAHLSERRYENLISSSHFSSIDELSEYVQAKDYHDIYIGDYIPITIPFTRSSNGSTTQSGSYTVNFRVVDINYLLDKTAASVSSQHLVLMPDNPIGECVMTMVQGDYESELVEIPGSGWYSSYGRGYYNNNMTQNALPKILTSLKSQFGSSHILSFNDSVPIYYSDSYYGGYLTNVQYQSVPNTQIRLPTRITMNGRILADSNAVWTQQFRLYATDTNYEYISKPAISNLPSQGRSGCLLTDLYTLSSSDKYSSSLNEMFWRIQDGGAGRVSFDYEEGPVCPIIIFG